MINLFKAQQGVFTKVTATGAVSAEPANLLALLLTHDGTNNPTFTIYDDAAAATAGREFYSGTWTDADRPIGWVNCRIRFQRGIYVVISNIGTGWFTFVHNTKYVLTGGA